MSADRPRAMVLAAGLGLRMRPLTRRVAKPALPVLHRPLVHWTLERLARHGVRDVVINLHHLPGSVIRAVGDGAAFGLRVTYSRERAILGTGGGPRRVRRFFADAPALLVNGDALVDFDFSDLLARHRRSGARATLALKPNPDPVRYPPVVTAASGSIVWLRGLGRRRRGKASMFTGVHVIDPAILERLPAGPSDSIGDLYAGLLRDGERLMGCRVRGAWYDFGTPASYLESHWRLLRSGLGAGHSPVHPEARVHADAHVSRSVVGPGARIGPGARVRRSVLWAGARVGEGARVEDSVLASGVRVPARAVVCRQVLVPGPGGCEAHAL